MLSLVNRTFHGKEFRYAPHACLPKAGGEDLVFKQAARGAS
jgi:hypothetical protein